MCTVVTKNHLCCAYVAPHQVLTSSVDQAAHVLAPCPHDGVCPMQGTKGWCHFSQRFERSKLQRDVKNVPGPKGPRSFQDERYSYVILKRGSRPLQGHHTLVTPHTILPVETIRRLRNVVFGGVDDDNITLEDAIQGYEGMGDGVLLQGDWDAGMAEQVSVQGGAWESEAAPVMRDEERVYASKLLGELQRARLVRGCGGGDGDGVVSGMQVECCSMPVLQCANNLVRVL